jgi:CHAD domain-containing protein
MGAKTGLRFGHPVGDGLRAFATGVLNAGRAAVDNSALSDAVAVHDFRKAMKHWRALLRLLEPIVGDDADRLRLAARDLARELAAARDSQSALDALADLHKSEHGFSATSWATIRARLEELRQKAETVALTDTTRTRLRAYLEECNRAVEDWPLADAAFAQVAAALTEGYARARRVVPSDWNLAEDEELHELRQRVVVHRYQLPLVEQLWPRLNRLLVAEAQRMRERLGAHQDLTVLTALTGVRQPLAPWRSRLAPVIAARKAAHVAAAARIAARLFAERPRAFRRHLLALWKRGRDLA